MQSHSSRYQGVEDQMTERSDARQMAERQTDKQTDAMQKRDDAHTANERMSVFDVVMKLNGHVHAIGSHEVDIERLEALKSLTSLLDELLQEVRYAARTAGHSADSMNQIGTYAKKYLEGIRNDE
jgi:hypothetical protein